MTREELDHLILCIDMLDSSDLHERTLQVRLHNLIPHQKNKIFASEMRFIFKYLDKKNRKSIYEETKNCTPASWPS
jgi:hypothetical protein